MNNKYYEQDCYEIAEFCLNRSNCIGCKLYKNTSCHILRYQEDIFRTIVNQKAEIEKYKDEALTFKCEYEHQTDLLESKEEDCLVLDTLNTKLQKQVDELTIVNANLIKRINRTVKNTTKEILKWLKAEVIMTEIPHGSEPCEEDVEAVMWWQIEEHFKKKYGVEA